MNQQLSRKCAVVTGAAHGIGQATAELFAAEGANVIVADRSLTGEAIAAGIRAGGGAAWFHQVDVASPEQVNALMAFAAATMGGIDIIVNNAGQQLMGVVTDFEVSAWDQMMAVNPRSCFLGAKYGVPYLRQRGGGVIINTASVAGIRGGANGTAYAASKGAIIAFSRALAMELAPDRIRVNAMCPGWVDTPFNDPIVTILGGPAAHDTLVQNTVPLRRQGHPSEIAAGMLFLASDASAYMTGQTLVIDGGLV
jgi:dihydroanticapsin dehydrogenase